MKRVLAIAVTVLQLSSPHVHAGDALGALFTTPAQRAQLDRLSLNKGEETVVDETAPAVAAQEQPVRKVKVGGFVVNSKGQSTTWLNHDNGAAVTNADKIVKATAAPAGKVDVLIQRDGKQISLKPGQEFDTDTGKVRDAYQDGAATGNTKCRASKAADGETRVSCGPGK